MNQVYLIKIPVAHQRIIQLFVSKATTPNLKDIKFALDELKSLDIKNLVDSFATEINDQKDLTIIGSMPDGPILALKIKIVELEESVIHDR